MTHKYLSDEVLSKMVVRHRASAAVILSELFFSGSEGKVMTVSEAARLAKCSRQTIYRIAGEGVFVTKLTTIEELRGGQLPDKVQIPTLEQLETILGCTEKRKFTIEFTTAAELKAEVAALPIKQRKGKEGDFSTIWLAKKAGMSKNTLKKHIKKVAKVEERYTDRPLTLEEMKKMPESYKDYIANRKKGDGWTFLKVGKTNFAYSLPQALLAIQVAGSLEGVTVRVQQVNHYKYTGVLSEADKFAQASEDTYNGNMTLEDFKKMYPDLFPKQEHREHSQLLRNFVYADEFRHRREREEERRILQVASFRKL